MRPDAAPGASGLPIGRLRTGSETRSETLARARQILERESLLVLSVSVFAVAFVLRLSGQVNQDAWLAVAGGRWVVEHGLPHHELWTVWGAGRDWVDQQWLGQTAMYGLFAAGGWGLLATAHALLTGAAYAVTVVLSRRRGASARSVLLPLPLCFYLLILSTWQVRTQTFAYLLFVACLWLVVEDARRPSSQVFLCLPLVALWANLHGSVVLGAGLVALRGLHRAIKDGRRSSGLALAALAVLAVFASPYATDLAAYYHRTLFNPAFSSMLNEWQPPTPGIDTAPFYALALAVVWLLGRSRGALNGFERLVLVFTLVGALGATRNLGWFALAAILLVPAMLDEVFPGSARTEASRSGPIALLAGGTALTVVVLLGVTLARPASWFTSAYPEAAGAAVTRAAEKRPEARIYADVRYADWLLFEHPELAGRIAYDARFEVLPSRRIAQIYDFNDVYGATWPEAIRGFPILVLDRTVSKRPIAAILRRPGAHRLYAGHGVVVLDR